MSEKKEEKDAIAIMVGDDNKENGKDDKDVKDKKKKKGKKGEEPDEMSDEDKALKEGLELAVNRIKEPDAEPGLVKMAIDHLSTEIKSATSSMTSVPKPLKFLRPYYDTLKGVYQSWSFTHPMKKLLADVMSVLAMTMQPANSRECLKFKLQGTNVNVASWGHEYVRSLAGEISEEYNHRSLEAPVEDDIEDDDLLSLVDDIVPFQMQHNAEAEAVDLLMEVQQLSKLVNNPVVDERNYSRVCLYLMRCADYISDPDDLYNLFNTAYSIYKSQKKYTDALRVALKMDDSDTDKLIELFSEEVGAPAIVKKQMALLLGRHKSGFILEDESLNELIGNTNLSERYLNVARDMGLSEPKTPQDIYKTSGNELSGRRNGASSAVADSARANLASTFVNAFVNAGYCTDKQITTEGNSWVHKNKDYGMLSAAASMGLIWLWNVDEGLNQIDKFLVSNEDYIKAGGCLAVGLVSSGIRNPESEPALAVLTEYIDSKSSIVRIATICGLGIAYAGAQKEEIMELLVPIVANVDGADIVEVSVAALALGIVYVGTCNDEVGSVLVERLMSATEDELNHTMTRFICLGLGLLYLGKAERADAMIEAVKVVEHKRGKYAELCLITCAYAGSGNVLKVQSMLHICAEHLTENAEHQAVAVLGIALISVGEDIGTEMTLRTFEHLLHYGELPVKRVVPLALALLYVSNPDYGVIDQLSRLSHDGDAELSQNAILGLGIVSAGSNNSRVAGILRQLSDFYNKDQANHLFLVRIAQGLNAMGKGLVGISPFHSDRFLMNCSSMAGLLAVLHGSLDSKNILLDNYHYILYFLTTAINPRVLMTVDEDLKPISTNVRVGLAVETVGQAGRPKTISGFQTHTTPVLLGCKERAELATAEHTSVTSIIEGTVILEAVPQLETEMTT